jgi:hypothetical protein
VSDPAEEKRLADNVRAAVENLNITIDAAAAAGLIIELSQLLLPGEDGESIPAMEVSITRPV